MQQFLVVIFVLLGVVVPATAQLTSVLTGVEARSADQRMEVLLYFDGKVPVPEKISNLNHGQHSEWSAFLPEALQGLESIEEGLPGWLLLESSRDESGKPGLRLRLLLEGSAQVQSSVESGVLRLIVDGFLRIVQDKDSRWNNDAVLKAVRFSEHEDYLQMSLQFDGILPPFFQVQRSGFSLKNQSRWYWPFAQDSAGAWKVTLLFARKSDQLKQQESPAWVKIRERFRPLGMNGLHIYMQADSLPAFQSRWHENELVFRFPRIDGGNWEKDASWKTWVWAGVAGVAGVAAITGTVLLLGDDSPAGEMDAGEIPPPVIPFPDPQ